MRRIWPVLGLLAVFVSHYLACAAVAGQTGRLQGQIYGKGWKQMTSAAELGLHTTAKVETYLKKDNGSLILIRSGRSEDFGVSAHFTSFSSDDAEMVYLMKLIPGGDYIGETKLESKNPLLSHAKAYSYRVQNKRLGPTKILAVMIKGRDIVLIEFLAKEGGFDEDRLEFFKFLDSLKENNK